MRVIAFSDPNCPFCYATEERLHRLGLAERVAWRGVEHAPELPVPARPGAVAPHELSAEVEAIRARAPEVEIASPPAKPSTARALRHGAAALRRDPAAGRRFVRSLYRALWVDGDDLSDLAVLARLARAAGLDGLRPDDEDAALVDSWREQWLATGLQGVPLLLSDDGRSLYGLVGEGELRAFFG